MIPPNLTAFLLLLPLFPLLKGLEYFDPLPPPGQNIRTDDPLLLLPRYTRHTI